MPRLFRIEIALLHHIIMRALLANEYDEKLLVSYYSTTEYDISFISIGLMQ